MTPRLCLLLGCASLASALEPWNLSLSDLKPGVVPKHARAAGDQRCGVAKPLFKETVKVEPIQGPVSAWQQGVNTVLGWVGHLHLPFFGGGDEPRTTTPPPKHELHCLMPYLMNCTTWDELALQKVCPDRCPFIAQLKPFACTFTCVNETQCHYTDVNMPFADSQSKMCEHGVDGCEEQVEMGVCQRCRQHFAMRSDGVYCLYDREGSFIWFVDQLHNAGYWGWAVLVFLLLCCLWQCRTGTIKRWDLLTFARMHYHLCKVRKNPKFHAGAPLFSLCEALHSKFIIGVGLPLYYNSLVCLIIISGLLLLASHYALDGSTDSLFKYSGMSANPQTVLGMQLYPSSEGVTDASICGWAMSGEAGPDQLNVTTTSKSFMERMSLVMIFLYTAVLVVVLIHAYFQLQHARWFERQHLTMKDRALVLSGFPPHATDEPQIIECLSQQLGEHVEAVSIGYDYSGRIHEIQALIDRHLAYMDAEARGGYPEHIGLTRAPVKGRHNRAPGPEAMELGQKDDAELVKSWFQKGSETRMTNSGFAWAVFPSHRDRDEALHKALALDKDRRSVQWHSPDRPHEKYPIKFGVPRCEPTNVRWENLGKGICCRRLRLFGALLMWLAASAALALLVYWPYAMYITSFLNEAGKFPQGFMMGLLGFLIGLTWWAMCMVIGTCAGFAAFQTIEDEYIFIFITFTHFCVAASAFNVYLTWYYTQDLWSNEAVMDRFQHNLIAGPVSTLRDLRKEIDLGFRVFQLLVPGVLFTPCLLNPLNNFLIPYFRESLLLVLFGEGKSGREAERFLEPLPIGLAWDYQGHATLPFCCCLTFFLMSPSMWWATFYLVIWGVFFYFFQRFMHLRVCKKMYCTSNKLDSFVLYVGWGLLLAELAACYAYWQVRLQEWEPWSIPKIVLASYVLYWPLLRAVGVQWPVRFQGELDRLEKSKERSDDDRTAQDEAFCYNWLNVNPVYVLKSQYCQDEVGYATPSVFYEPGKEYLQLDPHDDTRGRDHHRWDLSNGGIWLELEGLGCIDPVNMCGEVGRGAAEMAGAMGKPQRARSDLPVAPLGEPLASMDSEHERAGLLLHRSSPSSSFSPGPATNVERRERAKEAERAELRDETERNGKSLQAAAVEGLAPHARSTEHQRAVSDEDRDRASEEPEVARPAVRCLLEDDEGDALIRSDPPVATAEQQHDSRALREQSQESAATDRVAAASSLGEQQGSTDDSLGQKGEKVAHGLGGMPATPPILPSSDDSPGEKAADAPASLAATSSISPNTDESPGEKAADAPASLAATPSVSPNTDESLGEKAAEAPAGLAETPSVSPNTDDSLGEKVAEAPASLAGTPSVSPNTDDSPGR